ncbi:MAG: hypothetical protein WEC37_02815 [Anaerolineales bacterium]
MLSPSERLAILDRLEKGEINPEEAARLLSAKGQAPEHPAHGDTDSPMGVLGRLERGEINADEAARRLEQVKRPRQNSKANHTNHSANVRVRNITNETFSPARTWGWWMIPIAVGAVITALSGWWMSRDTSDGRLGFWFFFAFLPLLFGVGLIILGWVVRRSHWVHLQAKSEKRGRKFNVNLNLPIPFELATGLMEGFGIRIRGFDADTVEQIKSALQKVRAEGQPVHIQTTSDDGEDDVDIYIS